MLTAAAIDLHVVNNFFDAGMCRDLIDEIRRAQHSSALTYGHGDSGTVEERIRRVKRATLDDKTVDQVAAQLRDHLSC